MSHFQHPDDLWVGGDSVTDTIAAASTAIALPTLDAGDSGVPGATAIPKRVAVTTNASTGVWIKFGQSGVSVSSAGDGSDGFFLQKQIGYVTFVVAGHTHIAHFGTASDLITITPLND
jgi:hypothetical protein